MIPELVLSSLMGAGLPRTGAANPVRFAPVAQDPLPAGWNLLQSHSDEFEGPELDRSKWQVDLPHWGLWSWRGENVSVGRGLLRLTMTAQNHVRDGKSLYYTAGIVRSRAEPLLYAYVEARIRAAPRWPGVASAFWLFRNTAENWTEIDVVEMMQRRSARNILDFSHYVLRGEVSDQLPVRRKVQREIGWDPAAGFHVYSALWTPDAITYYVDGRSMGRFENTYWHHSMDLVLSLALRAPLDAYPTSEGFPTSMEVDYVRCWGAGAEETAPGEAGSRSTP